MVKLTVVFESLAHDSVFNAFQEADYEHGLMLLLNAADLDLEVQAIFMVGSDTASKFSKSLVKKLRQLELFEVPCFSCVLESRGSGSECEVGKQIGIRALQERLDFVQALSYAQALERVSASAQVLFV